MPRMDIELLTLTEAARRIGISRDVVRDLINSGWIATIELPGGSRRVPAQAVADWIERTAQTVQDKGAGRRGMTRHHRG